MTTSHNATHLFEGIEIEVTTRLGVPWFKAIDVLRVLNQGMNVVINCVESDCKMMDNEVLFIDDLGVYSLAFLIETTSSACFIKWVRSIVLQSIRKVVTRVGLKHNQFQVITEYDLHTKVVGFIREYYPEAILVVACGENQDTSSKRISSWRKGYQRGTPDLIIANTHEKYSGLVIEFKNPGGTGKCSDDQKKMLFRLEVAGYRTLLCDSYDEAIRVIIEYFSNVRFRCLRCTRDFKSKVTLNNHSCCAGLAVEKSIRNTLADQTRC